MTWTAKPGSAVEPGEYQDFSFASDALPAAGEMVLPVGQFYSDGTVVQWTEPTVSGKAEPEHPAPVFTVTAATETAASASPAANSQATGTTAPVSTTTDNTARVLGGAALVLAAIVGGLVLLRRRPKEGVR